MHILPNLESFIHFTGIGGIGMSGLAEILHNKGFLIKGSDLVENSNIRRLKEIGIPICQGHSSTNIRGAYALVISSAVPDDNPEVVAAREARIPIITRGEMLAEVVRLKKTVAISGMHGKTTTTSIIASLLNAAAFEPTIINGGIINKLQTNAKLGGGEWFVVEADESDGSFLKIPSIINVVVNIDREHMNFFQTYENVEAHFRQFIHNVPFYGVSVVCSDDETVRKIIEQGVDRRVITYGLTGSPDVRGTNVRVVGSEVAWSACGGSQATKDSNIPSSQKNCGQETRSTGEELYSTYCSSKATDRRTNKLSGTGYKGIVFDAVIETKWLRSSTPKIIKDIFLPMFGSHNVLNALAGVAVSLELEIDEAVIKDALANFSGVKRRFSFLGNVNGVVFIDDYAHHPAEIKAVIEAAKQAGPERIVVVFQPHRYTRFADLWDRFALELSEADIVIAMPVYTAGEQEISGIDSSSFVRAFNSKYGGSGACMAYYVADVAELTKLLKEILKIETRAETQKTCEFVIGMGAGSISEYMHNVYDSLR
ncbi:MAG: UDP-N-acetylmuramate--L-alanine ligase [Holosporales bacterium]|jgi:UDP-N-acetylmuramate--alanine ligase|nr:UDP-N-acetylmuramate--L-alanine ligase [Holosporales bacterium]